MWTLTVHMYHWCSALTRALATSIHLWGFEMLQHSVNSLHILDIHCGQGVYLKLKIDVFSYFFISSHISHSSCHDSFDLPRDIRVLRASLV